MKNLRHIFLTLFIALAAGKSDLIAQVTFSITATANSSTAGFTSGQSYTFVFTTNPDFSETVDSVFSATTNMWRQEESFQPTLFSSITGSGLWGAFAPPADPAFYVQTTDNGTADSLVIAASSESDYTGLGFTTTPQYNIYSLQVNLPGILNFSNPQAYTDLSTYFASYAGTYVVAGATLGVAYFDNVNFESDSFSFDVQSITIAVPSSIPEPSTYALLFGLTGLVALAGRRHLRRS